MAERKRTNAEIDLLNSYLKEGETPLPYELDAEGNELKPIELTPEQKLEAEQKIKDDEIVAAKQKELDTEAEKEKQRIIAQDAEKNKFTSKENIPAPIEVELDDDKILAYLKNKKGKDLTSLDELLNPKKELTEQEKQELAEKRESDKISYGLSTGKFSKKELESFITDSKNKTDLVYAYYSAEQKSKNPELKEEDIKSKFEEKFSIDEGEESNDYKVGQSLINTLADNIIRNKHAKILNLDNEFTSYENEQLSKKQSEAKILSQAPLYKKDVEQIRNEIKKVSIPISDTENFETELEDKVVEEIISGMLDNKYSQKQIQDGWNVVLLKQIAQSTAIVKSLPLILKKYGEAEVLKKQAGTRGITPENTRGGKSGNPLEDLTENQKYAINFMKGETTIAN